MNLKITPAKLKGSITPPPSKSYAHRGLIAAALADGVSSVSNIAMSQDISATLSCLRALGAGVVENGNTIELHGLGSSIPQAGPFPILDCGESGSTLRFLIPIALAVTGGAQIQFTGQGRLMERPQKPYFDLFEEKGIFFEQHEGVLTLRGSLTPGDYSLPGDVSSQFVTGLLYALPLLNGSSSRIILTSPLESRDYVEMTAAVIRHFGVRVEETTDGWLIPGNQTYKANHLTIEADWSQAGFWYAAQCLGNDVSVVGMPAKTVQGDACVAPYSRCLSLPGDGELNVSQCPDLVPPLAAMAALRRGTTKLTNAARLRIKESDRLATVTQTLNTLGAQIEEYSDSLTIHGVESLTGNVCVDCCNDHRIAMMAAVAATRCQSPITLLGAQCVSKSYPNFWEDYVRLGGQIEEVQA